MSSEKTPNLELHSWSGTDKVDYVEINENFSKLDLAQKQNNDKFLEVEQKIDTDIGTIIDSVSGMEDSQALIQSNLEAIETKQGEIDESMSNLGLNAHAHDNKKALDNLDEFGGNLLYKGYIVKTSANEENITWGDIVDKPMLAPVATSGNYSDLQNKPSIPASTSDVINDSGYITQASVPTATSQLVNDSGFVVGTSIPTKVSELQNDSDFMTTTEVETMVADGLIPGNVKGMQVLTQAAYDALPATKTTDNTLYFIRG